MKKTNDYLDAIDVLLICGGKYHDFDFARLELLKLLAEYPELKTTVRDNYDDVIALKNCKILITYTCDIVPKESLLVAYQAKLAEGMRWFALHGTNSLVKFVENGRVSTPELAPKLKSMLGSQFVGHPAIGKFLVEVTDSKHPLTQGISDFEVEDEQYLVEASQVKCLLHTNFGGRISGFIRRDWPMQKHPVMYLVPQGKGSVLYLTLGHCRGHYDMKPLMDYYPVNERCSWQSPIYYELLRRGLQWAMRQID